MKLIGILPGDGIGPEVITSALDVLSAFDTKLSFHIHDVGFGVFQETGCAISPETIEACRRYDAVLYGANTNPPGHPDYESVTLTLRKELGLFANVRPAKTVLPNLSRWDRIDLTVIRENSEGLYVREEEETEEGAIAIRRISRAACERIVRYACQYAITQGKQRVTLVHKANVLKKTCGLFRETGFEVAKDFPTLTVDERLVDAMAMELIRKPEEYEVIVSTNLFGDILSDEASALVGGLGVAPGANIGHDHAVFEPIHGSAPDIAGTGKANPLATLLSAQLMLEHLELPEEAARLSHALLSTLKDGIRTPDLGGTAGTRQFTDEVVARI